MTSSVSYSSPLSDTRSSSRSLSQYDTHRMEKSFSSGDNNYTQQPEQHTTEDPEIEQLQHQLDQLNQSIVKARQEVVMETDKKEQLQTELEEARKNYQERESEYSQIEHNFFQLTRAVRATDDDLSTIRDSLKLLKYNISRVVMSLNKKANKSEAKSKFLTLWPHLTFLDDQTGDWIEPGHVNFLAEKLVHHHLARSVFECPVYPGLDINEAYASMTRWFEDHDNTTFSVRLRQQMAVILVKNKDNDELQQAVQQEKKRIAEVIYNDLADIYSPFIRENDAMVNDDKSYYAKVMDILDKAFKLTVAMRGQEVNITTLDLDKEGQELDEETMVEVRGKTSGIVRFSICPAFIGGDGEHGFLEKGKVVVV
ncbi:hypothetical protein BC941DRAFT_404724 [Chlamydoabsidia padenii]|nr:hypothetical protein BC941DRAFT_404724 [Chlamydoabsidia padenii]